MPRNLKMKVGKRMAIFMEHDIKEETEIKSGCVHGTLEADL